MKKVLIGVSIGFSAIGVALMVVFALNSSFFNGGSWVINPTLAGNLGDLTSGIVGSLFTLVGSLLIYLTLHEQGKQFNIQQFESKLFELIKYHRENASEISHTPATDENKVQLRGRDVFIQLKRELLFLFSLINSYLSENEIDIEEQEVIGMAYTIFFFGVAKRTELTTKGELRRHYQLNDDLISDLWKYIRNKKTRYDKNIVRFGGHQSKLGFYFRHIYRTINYIDEYKGISDLKKIEYSKLLRSQLTNYEQAVLFCNSLSHLGERWSAENRGVRLIEKYEMIKNIPPHLLGEINIRRYYPNINYEYEWPENNNV